MTMHNGWYRCGTITDNSRETENNMAKLHYQITFYGSYNADPSDYGTTDSKEMAAIDLENVREDFNSFLEAVGGGTPSVLYIWPEED